MLPSCAVFTVPDVSSPASWLGICDADKEPRYVPIVAVFNVPVSEVVGTDPV